MLSRVPSAFGLLGLLLGLFLDGCRQPDANPASTTTEGARAATAVAAPLPDFPHEPTPSDPVVAAGVIEAADAAAAARVKPGETFTLAIHVRIAPAWHIYPHDATGTPNTPTQLSLELPAGIEALEEWEHPSAHRNTVTGASELAGALVFRHRMQAIATAAPGGRELRCVIAYQACDPFMCRPPERLTVSVPLTVAR